MPLNDQIVKMGMQYEKGVTAEGKGYTLIPKPAFGYTVNVEVSYYATDNDTIKNCVGLPTLKFNLKGAPAPGPKNGGITSLKITKSTYAKGETIPAILGTKGDQCRFMWRIRKLPFINLSDDTLFEDMAYPFKVNERDLNNLGQSLAPGNWVISVEPRSSLLPGEVNCTITPGLGSGQVFFTVTP